MMGALVGVDRVCECVEQVKTESERNLKSGSCLVELISQPVARSGLGRRVNTLTISCFP